MRIEKKSLKIFSHARFALKHALIQSGFLEGDEILVPEYNCDVIYHPLRQLGLNINYYETNDNFEPDWNQINAKVSSSTKALLMVHYFGQPQDIKKFRNFCTTNDLILIEDNAHGHGGKLNDRLLGTFGDIGFSSPRKFSDTTEGASFYINGEEQFPSLEFPLFDNQDNNVCFRTIANIFPARLKRIIKNKLVKPPDFTDPFIFLDEELILSTCVTKKNADKDSEKKWEKIAEIRRDSWVKWAKWAKKNGLKPLRDEPHAESNPWLFPMYADTFEQRNELLGKAWFARFGFAPWPGLPIEVIEQNGVAINRWKRLICCYLDEQPDENRHLTFH